MEACQIIKDIRYIKTSHKYIVTHPRQVWHIVKDIQDKLTSHELIDTHEKITRQKQNI